MSAPTISPAPRSSWPGRASSAPTGRRHRARSAWAASTHPSPTTSGRSPTAGRRSPTTAARSCSTPPSTMSPSRIWAARAPAGWSTCGPSAARRSAPGRASTTCSCSRTGARRWAPPSPTRTARSSPTTTSPTPPWASCGGPPGATARCAPSPTPPSRWRRPPAGGPGCPAPALTRTRCCSHPTSTAPTCRRSTGPSVTGSPSCWSTCSPGSTASSTPRSPTCCGSTSGRPTAAPGRRRTCTCTSSPPCGRPACNATWQPPSWAAASSSTPSSPRTPRQHCEERDVGLRAWAPGRVNLIGDHTDYMGGLVLPMAIGLGTEITGDRGGNWVMLGSDRFEGVAEIPLGGVEDPAAIDPPWARYVAAVVDEVDPDDGLVGMVQSTLPAGSGLASSAALEVAVATALGADLDDPLDVAQACQRAEQRAVGVPVGIMDQLVSLAAVEGSVLRIDCDTLTVDQIPFPEDAEIVVLHSGEHRELSGSAYAERRAECEAAEAAIGHVRLRDASPVDVEAIDDPVLRRRARHVTTENQRVDALASALSAGQLAYAGELLVASHASLRDDFEVSTPILDALVGTVRGVPGVY